MLMFCCVPQLAAQQTAQNISVQGLAEVAKDTIIDDWASDPTLDERQYLILSMLTLQRLDYRMFLGGLADIGGRRDIGTFPEDVARLLHPSMHRTIRLSVAKTSLATMASIISDLSTRGPNSEPPDLLRVAIAAKCVLYLFCFQYTHAYSFAIVPVSLKLCCLNFSR